MEKIDSIIRDIDHNIQVSPAEMKALGAHCTLSKSTIISLENKIKLFKTMLKAHPSPAVVAQVSAIL